MRSLGTFLLAVLSVNVWVAVGQPATQPQRGQRLLQQFDKDGDGQLSQAEREEARRRWQENRRTSGEGQQQQARPNRRAAALPEGAKGIRDVEYARVDGKPLRLDIYLPPDDEKLGRLPVVVWIHGGGWQSGSKDNCPVVPLCGEGYAVVSVNYRLTDVAAFPAQIHDCKGAIRWIRANAAKHGFDPKGIAVAGSSAGGHLVALLGTGGEVKELEGDVGGNLDQSSRVQAVCDFCGPAAFFEEGSMGKDPQGTGPKAVVKLLGGPLSENQEKARLASPVVHVSKDDPPFLIVHGDKDPLVPLDQSRRLAAALEKAGVPVKLHVVEGGGHGVLLPETLRTAKQFIDKQLKGEASRPGAKSQ